MNAVENQVRELVKVELSAANERFQQFHSQHEGWAVILEELEETKEQLEAVERFLSYAWNRIKDDVTAREQIDTVALLAENAACEAIQVAAMCKKFLEMEGEKK